MKDSHGQRFGLTSSVTDSIGFRMFMIGYEKRMGRLVIQELGFTVEVVLEILNGWDMMLESEEIAVGRKRDIIVVGATLVVLAGGALRGGEVLLMEASKLVKRRLDGRKHPDHPHVVIPLMGRFKDEVGKQNMLLTLSSETSISIPIQKWVERLIIILLMREGQGNRVGPAICERDGFLMPWWKINGILHESLLQIQQEAELIPDDSNVPNKYSMH